MILVEFLTLFELKPNANLQTQRPTKIPIHYLEKLNALLDELEKNGFIRQIG